MLECPKCHKQAGFTEIAGQHPGWECRSCGLFYAKQTWELRDGTLKRKHPKPVKKKRSYVDWTAVSGRMPYSSAKADDSDAVAELIDEGVGMTAVFECPECRHICEQTEMRVKRPAAEGFEAEKEDILWQCGHCFVIYTERYRWKVEERRRRRRERHKDSG